MDVFFLWRDPFLFRCFFFFFFIFPFFVLFPMLSVSLNCRFLVVLSVFSNVFSRNEFSGITHIFGCYDTIQASSLGIIVMSSTIAVEKRCSCSHCSKRVIRVEQENLIISKHFDVLLSLLFCLSRFLYLSQFHFQQLQIVNWLRKQMSFYIIEYQI